MYLLLSMAVTNLADSDAITSHALRIDVVRHQLQAPPSEMLPQSVGAINQLAMTSKGVLLVMMNVAIP